MMIINYYLYRKTSNNQKTRYVEKRTNAKKNFYGRIKELGDCNDVGDEAGRKELKDDSQISSLNNRV